MNTVLVYLLESSACLILFYALYHFLFRGMTTFQQNRFYLLLSGILSLVIPILSFEVFPVYVELAKQITNATTDNVNLVPAELESSLALSDIVFYVYLIITTLFLLRFIVNILRILIEILSSKRKTESNYILVSNTRSKNTFSFFKYLFHPVEVPIDDEVLTHELSHIKQFHSLDILLSEIVKIILWFNPVTYLFQNEIRLNHEFICDANAATKSSVFQYAKFLSMVVENRNPSLASNFAYKIKNRLIMLEKLERTKNNSLKYFCMLPLLMGILLTISCDTYYIPLNEKEAMALDTIPNIKSKMVTVLDTVATFDPQTKTETFQVVESEMEVVEMIDTIMIYDPETMIEKIEIVKSDMPLEEYKELMKLNLSDQNAQQRNREISQDFGSDTITVFDPETYIETVTIVQRTNACYGVYWSHYLLGKNQVLNVKEGKELFQNTIQILKASRDSDCDKVKSFSGKIEIVSQSDSRLLHEFNESNNKINLSNELVNQIVSGSKIIIEDIVVNGDFKLDKIVIEIQ